MISLGLPERGTSPAVPFLSVTGITLNASLIGSASRPTRRLGASLSSSTFVLGAPIVQHHMFSLQIGSKSVYKNRAIAKISLTSTYLGVDYAYLRKIAAAIGAKYDVRLDLYTVDCKKVNKLPNMTLSVGDGFAYTWDVPPQDYVLKKVGLSRTDFLTSSSSSLWEGPAAGGRRLYCHFCGFGHFSSSNSIST